MPKIVRKTYNSYSGLMVAGTVPYVVSDKLNHLERAFWLTAQVESGGLFGSVMNYDGTAMTAGIHQAIMVYPKALAHENFNAEDDQGSLPALLRRIAQLPVPPLALTQLLVAFKSQGWTLAADGKLRYLRDGAITLAGQTRPTRAGAPVYGQALREVLSPGAVGGAVPISGAKRAEAELWVTLFSSIFSDPKTFAIQVDFGLGHFVNNAVRWMVKSPTRGTITLAEAVYQRHPTGVRYEETISAQLDLAMSFFWSNSVNAPAIALQKFTEAYRLTRGSIDGLPPKLIRLLGDCTYGRWDDDLPVGRYQRTRRIAMKSKLWPAHFFEGSGAIMPADL